MPRFFFYKFKNVETDEIVYFKSPKKMETRHAYSICEEAIDQGIVEEQLHCENPESILASEYYENEDKAKKYTKPMKKKGHYAF